MRRAFTAVFASVFACVCAVSFGADGVFKLGIIGATTSHVPAFIKTINDPNGQEIFKKFEVTSVYPGGTPDNPESWDRVETYTQNCVDAGLKVYSTIEEMLPEIAKKYFDFKGKRTRQYEWLDIMLQEEET